MPATAPSATSDDAGVRVFWPVKEPAPGPALTDLLDRLTTIHATRPDLVLGDWEATDDGFLIDLYVPSAFDPEVVL